MDRKRKIKILLLLSNLLPWMEQRERESEGSEKGRKIEKKGWSRRKEKDCEKR